MKFFTTSKTKINKKDVHALLEKDEVNDNKSVSSGKAEEVEQEIFIANESDENEEDGEEDEDDDDVLTPKKLKGGKFANKKPCVSCQMLIPEKAARCFNCHIDQPIDFNATISGATSALVKATKHFKQYSIPVFDDDDLDSGVVYTKYIFKIKDKTLMNLLQSFAQLSYHQKSDNSKKRIAYVTARALIVVLPRLKAYATAQPNAKIFIEFVNIVDGLSKQLVTEIKAALSKKKIFFDGLWYLFEPGASIYSWKNNLKLGSVVKSSSYSGGFFGDSFSVSATSIKSDGECFYYVDNTISQNEFEGVKKLVELNIHAMNKSSLKELTVRGKTFCALAKKNHYMQYTGNLLTSTGAFAWKVKADGRVMIDIATYNKLHPNNQNFVYSNRTNNGGMNNDPNSCIELDEDEYFMTWPTLPGFSFAAKQWGEFILDQTEEIIFDSEAFTRLVLPKGKKSLIRALVEDHRITIEEQKRIEAEILAEKLKRKDIAPSKRMFTDIISGKGGGCIFLLHGTPGVGKTLTAEAVSEHLHIPLYIVSVGELGTTPEALEKRLQNILELAHTWNCSILLDEADIFLEKRSKKDVVRNAMVGVFLRLLEYHQGVLFLTTNRLRCLDEAFSSRISVALHYNELDVAARSQVWSNFLVAAEDSIDKSINIEELSKYKLNGRQIRSCVRISQALARTEKTHLQMCHLLTTINVSVNFKTQFQHIKVEKKRRKPKYQDMYIDEENDIDSDDDEEEENVEEDDE